MFGYVYLLFRGLLCESHPSSSAGIPVCIPYRSLLLKSCSAAASNYISTPVANGIAPTLGLKNMFTTASTDDSQFIVQVAGSIQLIKEVQNHSKCIKRCCSLQVIKHLSRLLQPSAIIRWRGRHVVFLVLLL